jgi:hypothetical protein
MIYPFSLQGNSSLKDNVSTTGLSIETSLVRLFEPDALPSELCLILNFTFAGNNEYSGTSDAKRGSS